MAITPLAPLPAGDAVLTTISPAAVEAGALVLVPQPERALPVAIEPEPLPALVLLTHADAAALHAGEQAAADLAAAAATFGRLDGWLAIGHALLTARRLVLAECERRLGRPVRARGGAFVRLWGDWLRQHGHAHLAGMRPPDRHAAIDVAMREPEVRAWLGTLPAARRERLQHPRAIARAMEAQARGVTVGAVSGHRLIAERDALRARLAEVEAEAAELRAERDALLREMRALREERAALAVAPSESLRLAAAVREAAELRTVVQAADRARDAAEARAGRLAALAQQAARSARAAEARAAAAEAAARGRAVLSRRPTSPGAY